MNAKFSVITVSSASLKLYLKVTTSALVSSGIAIGDKLIIQQGRAVRHDSLVIIGNHGALHIKRVAIHGNIILLHDLLGRTAPLEMDVLEPDSFIGEVVELIRTLDK